jgi:V/A-type H+-transporting ATPase subunit D
MPPGRAGRLWLRHRLTAAERAVDLLDRKLRILQAEQNRLRELSQRTGEQWAARCAEAELWGLRATMLGGRRVLAIASGDGDAEVAVEYGLIMGVRTPADIVLVCPQTSPAGPEGTALAQARVACRTALNAACEHAAALSALRLIDAEAAVTRRRLQALSLRWIPRLRAALAEIEFVLEEQEREDGSRFRRRLRQPIPESGR